MTVDNLKIGDYLSRKLEIVGTSFLAWLARWWYGQVYLLIHFWFLYNTTCSKMYFCVAGTFTPNEHYFSELIGGATKVLLLFLAVADMGYLLCVMFSIIIPSSERFHIEVSIINWNFLCSKKDNSNPKLSSISIRSV